MKSRALFLAILFVVSLIPAAYSQEYVTPISLNVVVYTDGSTLVTYLVESDPTQVRVDVDLIGNNYNNLLIRDENSLPLASRETGNSITVDTIGASELTIVYSTYEFTRKDGQLWDLNLTSPVSTTVVLPKGAAIFDIGDIPLDLGTINGAQYIELPAGEIYVSFILSIPNLSAEAQSAIDEADSYLATLENRGYILTSARNQLTQAEEYFTSDKFLDAKNIANNAMDTADTTSQVADSALTEIHLATSSIEQAQSEGRTDGLTQAQNTLVSAETYYSQGLYSEAEISAKQASQLALTADKPSGGNTWLYILVLLVVAGAAGGYYYMQNIRGKEESTPTVAETRSDVKPVNHALIFEEHPDLRLEDREVIKFLAENNGEAFATEIRDRFDFPRSSAWRLVRRLVSLEIVEEIKMGNQSLIRIRNKYLG